jgi:hypothetical protein
MIIYIIYVNIKKSRYIKYNFNEKKKLNNGIIYYNMQYYYLNFDNKTFNEILIKFPIFKFRKIKYIKIFRFFHFNNNSSKYKFIINFI